MPPLSRQPKPTTSQSPMDYAEHTVQQLMSEWMLLSKQIEGKLALGDVEALNQLMLRRGQCLKMLQKYFRGQSLPVEDMEAMRSTLKHYATVDQQLKDKVGAQMTLLQQKMGQLGQSRQHVGCYKQTLKSSSHTRGFA